MRTRSFWVVALLAIVVIGTVLVRRASPLLGLKRGLVLLSGFRARTSRPDALGRRPFDVGGAPTTDSMPADVSDPLEAGDRLADAPQPSSRPSAPVLTDVPAVTHERLPGQLSVPLGPRRRFSTTALVATASCLGVLALAVGGWSFFAMAEDRNEIGSSEPVVQSNGPAEEAATLLAKLSTRRIPFAGSEDALTFVVGDQGKAFLVLTGLPVEPAGKSYQAWVVRASGAPVSAAVFSGSSRVVALELPVPRGATVAITLEPAGGAQAPSSKPKLVAQRD